MGYILGMGFADIVEQHGGAEIAGRLLAVAQMKQEAGTVLRHVREKSGRVIPVAVLTPV